jgi:hypothetical protein
LFVFHFISPISAEFICFFIYADTAFPYAKNLIFAQSSSALCLRQSRKKFYFSGELIALAGFRFSERASGNLVADSTNGGVITGRTSFYSYFLFKYLPIS